MRYHDLEKVVSNKIFTLLDVAKYFPNESEQHIKIQLYRFTKQGLLTRLKRGVYTFPSSSHDELIVANTLYQPSYISLESALNYYGIIPDITQTVTSITRKKIGHITTPFGSFTYHQIKKSLYFGFYKVLSVEADEYYDIAQKEKALLDYFYIRKITKTDGLRLNLAKIDKKIYKMYLQKFPHWVQKIKI